MKKILLILLSIVVGSPAIAQPWLDKFDGQKVTLEQIAQDYRSQLQSVVDEEGTHEGTDYHFERWLNYWEGRTDKNGYLVSTRKHWEEYKKQQELYSKSLSKGTSNQVNWTFHGPDNTVGGHRGIGRINVVEFHPTDTNTYLIGTPGGGIWRTTDDGASWTVLDDFLPILGIADIDYNPINPNTIYICTGDRPASDTYSMGVFKSIDGGNTWDTTGFQYGFSEAKKTTGLVINPLDTNSLTLITTDSIFKSFDAGKTWKSVHPGSYMQILYHPTDTSILYVASTTAILRSTDGGMSWKSTMSYSSRRIEMAVTPANPSLLMLVVARSTNSGLEGIHRSTDTGKTFTQIYSDSSCNNNILANAPKGDVCGGQAWYDLSIAISPTNPDHIVVGGVNTWYSTDGGYYWRIANQWTDKITGVALVHADKHFHKFHPLKPSILYECNDGGIYKSGNAMTDNSIWNTLTNGLGITQFYRNAVAGNASFVLGGAQDNGTQMLSGGFASHISGGDGMDCHIDPTDSNIVYASSQNGEIKRSKDGGKKFEDIQNNIPGKPKGAWITPMALHPLGSNLIFAGYNKLYASSTEGNSWQELSPDFVTNMDRIALTKHSADYIFIMTSTSSHIIRYTTDYGAKWNNIKSLHIGPASDIMVDPNSKDSLWVTYRNYTGDKVAVIDIKNDTVYHTFNIGLPEVPINCITYDVAGKTFYIGTDLGVYYREEHNVYWTYFNNGTLPNVEVFDLGINPTTQTLWAATYGRGMWSTPLHNSTVGISTVPLAADVITIAPNPNYGEFSISTTNAQVKGKSSIIRIINMTGAVAWQQEVQINSDGKALISADLPRGTYIIELQNQNLIFAKTKMVVY